MISKTLFKKISDLMRTDDSVIKGETNTNQFRKQIGAFLINNSNYIQNHIWLTECDDEFPNNLKPNCMILQLARLVDNSYELVCNSHFTNVLTNHIDKSLNGILIGGMIAHELGHIDSNSESNPVTFWNNDCNINTKNIFPKIAKNLFRGDVFQGELSADIAALRYCNKINLIIMHLYFACNSNNLGVRWEHLNRAFYHLMKYSEYGESCGGIEFFSISEIQQFDNK